MKKHNSTLLLGKGQAYSLNTHKTKVNNNVLVIGAAGAGKTRGLVIPNILQKTGSYIITDPKGNLYDQYAKELQAVGYIVRKLDFTDPECSEQYNCLDYIDNTQDILKLTDQLVYMNHDKATPSAGDPFWDNSAALLISALVAYVTESTERRRMPDGIINGKPVHIFTPTLHDICRLISLCNVSEISGDTKTKLDVIMDSWSVNVPDSFAVNQYKKFRIAAGVTLYTQHSNHLHIPFRMCACLGRCVF